MAFWNKKDKGQETPEEPRETLFEEIRDRVCAMAEKQKCRVNEKDNTINVLLPDGLSRGGNVGSLVLYVTVDSSEGKKALYAWWGYGSNGYLYAPVEQKDTFIAAVRKEMERIVSEVKS